MRLDYQTRHVFNGHTDSRFITCASFTQDSVDTHIILKTGRSVSSIPWITPRDSICDFRKLPLPSHLGRCFIEIGKISAKIHEIGNNKGHFWIGNDSHIRL